MHTLYYIEKLIKWTISKNLKWTIELNVRITTRKYVRENLYNPNQARNLGTVIHKRRKLSNELQNLKSALWKTPLGQVTYWENILAKHISRVDKEHSNLRKK